ncbi:MAG: hypothetical protein IKJ43_00505 [Bacilli bacterium]|nr:hypothetical protein [Bacilli bacterium]
MVIFLGLGIGDNYQAKVKIYDKKCLVYEGMTYNGIVSFDFKDKAYRLVAKFCGQVIDVVIYGSVVLVFNGNKTVTFILRDSNYGIPIRKGEIVLWQR